MMNAPPLGTIRCYHLSLFLYFNHSYLGRNVTKRSCQPFLKLIKHGIILGNLVPVVAGFLLALTPARTSSLSLLLYTLAGIIFVIASATITNNIIDRDIDRIMERTKTRPLVNGDISITTAVILGVLFAIIGFSILYIKVNPLAGNLALVGFIDYVILYSLLFKRQSTLSILVGSISGAVPPLVGYVAITNTLDLNTFYLFIIFSSWQIAHSYAIALYRKVDYENANIPMPPLFMTIEATQRRVIAYILIMLIAVVLLIFNSFFFMATKMLTIILMVFWLSSAMKPIILEEAKWGKKQFLNSLLIIMGLCALIIIDHSVAFWI